MAVKSVRSRFGVQSACFVMLWGPCLGSQAAQQAPGWDRLDDCEYREGQHSDGDSIEVWHDGRRHVFRLYFVDCIEENPRSVERRAAQGRYFGITSEDEALRYAAEASALTRRELARPFRVYTRWEMVTPGSDNPSIRAFVETAEGKDLALLLVEAGLAIIRGGPALADHPEGRSREEILFAMREAETAARVAARGAWKPAARDARSPAPAIASERTNGALEATDTSAILARAGRDATVRGQVARVSTLPDGRLTFVNFAGVERGGFVGIIRGNALSTFERGRRGGLAAEIEGRTVELRGKITLYRDTPQIELRSSSQLRVVGD